MGFIFASGWRPTPYIVIKQTVLRHLPFTISEKEVGAPQKTQPFPHRYVKGRALRLHIHSIIHNLNLQKNKL